MTSISNENIFPIFNDLSAELKCSLARDSSELRPEKGQIIIRKGEKIGGAFLVKAGKLRVYTLDLNGNEKPIYTIEKGEICIFSVNCIFHKMLYPAWVSVDAESTQVLSVPTVTFRNLYENERKVRDYIVDSLSQRIFELMSVIEDLTILDVGQRINSLLVRLCPEAHLLTISHQEIATQLGTAREVVSRHLKFLEQSGYIVLSRMNIQVVNPHALAGLPPKKSL
jgi:CRP/FNR family transcriptional regulator